MCFWEATGGIPGVAADPAKIESMLIGLGHYPSKPSGDSLVSLVIIRDLSKIMGKSGNL